MKNYFSNCSTACQTKFVCLLLCLFWAQTAAGQTGAGCASIDNAQTFAASLYADVLGREPAREESQKVKESILKCTTKICADNARAAAADGVFKSPEFQNKSGLNIGENRRFVRAVYLSLLRREPTAAELQAKSGSLNRRGVRATLIGEIIESETYRARCFPPAQRLIYFGWDSPTADEMQNNWCAMQQQSAFDGITIDLKSDAGTSIMQKVFTNFRIDSYRFAVVTGKMKTATAGWKNSKTFTDNFIRLMLSPLDRDSELEGAATPNQPADFSWSNDKLWAQINKNAAAVAKVARDSGMKGLLLDPEQYNSTKMFSCDFMSEKDFPNTPKECFVHPADPFMPAKYHPLLRRRGKEFMQSILREYPDITIMTAMGHSAVHFVGRSMDLYSAFLDGILEAISEKKKMSVNGTIVHPLHDGMEVYGRRAPKGLQDLRGEALWAGRFYSDRKPLHDQLVYAAPPVWLDAFSSSAENAKYRWSLAAPFAKNYYTPAQLEQAVSEALQASDRYVWIYTERANFFGSGGLSKNIPQAYLDALSRAKNGAKRAD